MHLSLDGFVAGPNGEMDWIKVDDEIFDHVGKRISEGDTALYGRVTYQLMESYWPTAANKPNASKHDIEHSAWYSKVHKLVLSKTMKEADLPNTTIISENLSDSINKITFAIVIIEVHTFGMFNSNRGDTFLFTPGE